VRERIDALLDPGSFVELGALAGDQTSEGFVPSGYVGGLGRIDGRDVAVGGEDFTVRGGSERDGAEKVALVCALAKEYRVPLVLLHDGAGGNIENTIRRGYSKIPNYRSWANEMELLGIVPVVAGVMGSCAGGTAGRAMLSHWSVMPRNTAELFAAGPAVVKRALGVDLTKQALGGSQVHTRQSGSVDNEGEDEADCLRQMRRFLSYLPRNVWELPPYRAPADRPDRRDEGLLEVIPRNPRKPYDMRRLVRMVVDDGDFFELTPHYGKCVITAFARLNGHAVGVVANNPMIHGGALDGAGADKQTHFMDLCDQFHVPLVFFIDIPGFLVGPQAELAGSVRRGMRTFWLTNQVTVPVLQIYVRRCFGFGGAVSGNAARLNLRIGWPSGEWGGIPTEGGIDAAFRRAIEAAPDPAAKRAELEAGVKRLRSPFATAEALAVEDIIDPRDTRPVLVRFLETAAAVRAHSLGPKSRTGVRP
jgi:acetyl-CoA carboxylase carboxyltransferase component